MRKKPASVTVQLARRLLPLYTGVFFHGFVLWYAIEKLFMHHIGFNDAGIGVMVAVYSVVVLLAETPSGILADRWSRKGVLIIGSIFLAVSALLGGISTEPVLYVVSTMFWGLFYAFYSGTYDSVVYDTLIEETGNSNLFERYLGRIKIIDTVALMSGALLGGLLGQFFGLQATYLWAIPLALAAIVGLWLFKEPQLHKSEPLGTIAQQVTETFRAVWSKKALVRVVLLLIVITLIAEMLFEFAQLWIIAINTEPALYGPAFAAVLSSLGVAGFLAGKMEARRSLVIKTAYVGMFVATFALAFVTDFAAIVALQFMLGVAVVVLSIVCTRDLHDALPSRVRAGAASAVSTVGRAGLIPLGLVFGALSTQYSIFSAAWVMVGLVLIAVACQFWPRRT